MDNFNELFAKAEAYFKEFIGKPGYNPFFKLEEIYAIERSHKKGDKEAINKLKAIKLEPPVTTKEDKPIAITPQGKIVEPLPGPHAVEQAQEETQKTGVDIQTPKPVETPKKSLSTKK